NAVLYRRADALGTVPGGDWAASGPGEPVFQDVRRAIRCSPLNMTKRGEVRAGVRRCTRRAALAASTAAGVGVGGGDDGAQHRSGALIARQAIEGAGYGNHACIIEDKRGCLDPSLAYLGTGSDAPREPSATGASQSRRSARGHGGLPRVPARSGDGGLQPPSYRCRGSRAGDPLNSTARLSIAVIALYPFVPPVAACIIVPVLRAPHLRLRHCLPSAAAARLLSMIDTPAPPQPLNSYNVAQLQYALRPPRSFSVCRPRCQPWSLIVLFISSEGAKNTAIDQLSSDVHVVDYFSASASPALLHAQPQEQEIDYASRRMSSSATSDSSLQSRPDKRALSPSNSPLPKRPRPAVHLDPTAWVAQTSASGGTGYRIWSHRLPHLVAQTSASGAQQRPVIPHSRPPPRKYIVQLDAGGRAWGHAATERAGVIPRGPGTQSRQRQRRVTVPWVWQSASIYRAAPRALERAGP
ncbi:predicted protein, partial [Postia placenta Mad-698-R]